MGSYSNSVGIIVCEGVNINCIDLKAEKNKSLVEELLQRLFNKYEFRVDEKIMKRVKHKAMSLMIRALGTWRCSAAKFTEKDFKTFIHVRWPKIKEKDWRLFVASRQEAKSKEKSEWGRQLRSKNNITHRLGSQCYDVARVVWEKEDREQEAAGRQAPFEYLKEGVGKDFVRARAKIDKTTGQPKFNSKGADIIHQLLVSS